MKKLFFLCLIGAVLLASFFVAAFSESEQRDSSDALLQEKTEGSPAEVTFSLYTQDAKETLSFLDDCLKKADCYGSWAKSMGSMGTYEKNWIFVMANLPAGNVDAFIESVAAKESIKDLSRKYATPAPELMPGQTPSPTPVSVEVHSLNNSMGYLFTRNLPFTVHVNINIHVKYTEEESEKIRKSQEINSFFENGTYKLYIALLLAAIGLVGAMLKRINQRNR